MYSDALLSAHEAEIARLEALKEQRAPTLVMIEKHRSLVKDRDDLAASSQDASRLLARGQKGEKRDPTRLLREEKMRKRIAKDLPKIELELRKILEDWEDEYGRPFLVHGERYLDDLASASARAGPARSKTPVNAPAPTRSKTPSNLSGTVKSAVPLSRDGTVRGAQPPRSHTPSNGRNPLASSIRPPSSASTANFGSSVSAYGGSTIPRGTGRMSPSKIPNIPSRSPLSTMAHGNNSPERNPRPAILGHAREGSKSSLAGLMGPPRGHPAHIRDVFIPRTPTPMSYADMSERSASIVRQVDPDDVYDDHGSSRTLHAYQSYSNTARPPSELQNYSIPPSRPASQFGYPPAPPPPMSRQISNASSVITSNSAVSGSENWETYTDASDDYEAEADARADYYAKTRLAKRGTPEDGYDSVVQSSGTGKKVKGYGLGIGGGGLRAIGHAQHGISGSEGSEGGWTDVAETF